MEGFNVESIMVTPPVKLTADMDIADAIGIFVQKKISGAVVVDEDDNAIGYLSEVDCLQSYISGVYNEHTKFGLVRDFMSDEVDALSPNDDILLAARKFIDTRRRKFPVLDGKKVVGALNRYNLLKAIQDEGWG